MVIKSAMFPRYIFPTEKGRCALFSQAVRVGTILFIFCAGNAAHAQCYIKVGTTSCFDKYGVFPVVACYDATCNEFGCETQFGKTYVLDDYFHLVDDLQSSYVGEYLASQNVIACWGTWECGDCDMTPVGLRCSQAILDVGSVDDLTIWGYCELAAPN